MLKSLDERITELTRSILDEAKSDVEKIQAEAKQKESEILKRGKLQAEQLHTEILEKARRDAELRKEERLAEITVKARVEAYERREQLLEATFEAVRKRLPRVPDEPGYLDALMDLMREAILQLQSEKAILRFDAASRKLIGEEAINELGAEFGVALSIGEDLSEVIGVVAQDEKGHRIFENTLEKRLERQMERLRTTVFSILIGEGS